MPNPSSVSEAILAEIERLLTVEAMNTEMRARVILELAEAHAWIINPAQPHGDR